MVVEGGVGWSLSIRGDIPMFGMSVGVFCWVFVEGRVCRCMDQRLHVALCLDMLFIRFSFMVL